MSGFIATLICIYFVLLTFSIWSTFKITKHELKCGQDFTLGLLLLFIFVCVTPVVNLFFSLFVIAECRDEVFGETLFNKVLIKGK